MSSSSPYKPLGHRKNCKCAQCKLVREWNKKKAISILKVIRITTPVGYPIPCCTPNCYENAIYRIEYDDSSATYKCEKHKPQTQLKEEAKPP